MGVAYGTTTLHQATKGIVQDGLVLNLDAGVRDSYDSGTTWRDLKGGNDGTLTNMDSANLIKDNGGALTFDGSNDYIARSNFIGTTSTFSVCHWIKLAVNQNTRTIFSNYTSSNRGWVTGISDYAQNVVKFYLGNTVHLYASSALDVNVWYLVSVTYDNGNPKIYINDTLNNSSSATVVFGSTLYSNDIGRLGVGSQYFNGSIANVSVYNRALTAAEVSRNFNATRHRFGI
jgi:hypothetical protein